MNKAELIKTISQQPAEKIAIAFVDMLEVVAYLDGNVQNLKKMFLGGFRGSVINESIDHILKEAKEGINIISDELTKTVN